MYLFGSVILFFGEVKFPEVELLGCMAFLFLIFEKPPYCFPWWPYQFAIPPAVYMGFFPFFHILSFLAVLLLFENSLQMTHPFIVCPQNALLLLPCFCCITAFLGKKWFSKCASQASSFSVTWELVRNEHSSSSLNLLN